MLNNLERRIIDISYENKLSHIGSCLSCVNAIDDIYSKKGEDEPFILSNGHAGLALYVVLEQHGYGNAQNLIEKHGVHPNRCLDDKLYCTTGSLGMGLSVGVGMALADKNRLVYVMISDGECAEGSIWESLRIAKDLNINNLKVVCVCNGYGALSEIDTDNLKFRLEAFYPVRIIRPMFIKYPEWMQGLEAHYHVMTEAEYAQIIC